MTIQKFFVGKKASSFQEARSTLNFPSKAVFVKMEQVHGKKISEITSKNLKKTGYIL